MKEYWGVEAQLHACTNHELRNMFALQPGLSAIYWCLVVAVMEVHVMSYAEACVDQNHPSCYFLVPLLPADSLLAAGLGLGNEELMACLPLPQGSSDPLHSAEKPANQNSQFLRTDVKT
jgi:hypothetical protein